MQTPELRAKKTVLVDVYSWVAACATHGGVPMEGVWRVVEPFARRYQPAMFLLPGESVDESAKNALSAYLDRPIEVYRDVSQVNERAAVWFSGAVDFPSPYLSSPGSSALKVAVINDTLCTKGYFGEAKKALFEVGRTRNQAFLHISKHSLNEFVALFDAKGEKFEPAFLQYIGCPHRYEDVLPKKVPAGLAGVGLVGAVHSVYPRKRLSDEVTLAVALGEKLNHVGKWFVPHSAEDANKYVGHLKVHGPLSDEELDAFYQKIGVFVCLSEDEGFSMPAMEAIFAGCREVWLSDIPAHREVYGDLNINWIDIKLPVAPQVFDQKLCGIRHVTEQQVRELWKLHHPSANLPLAYAKLDAYVEAANE